MKWQLCGVRCGPLRTLRKPLDHWLNAQRKYGTAWEWVDASWWYNERTSTGMLAASFWLSKGIALEEYSTSKRARQRTNRTNKNRRGRCDLYGSVDGEDYIFEAKHYWLNLCSHDTFKQLENSVKDACDEARNSAVGEKGVRLGVVFVSPFITCSRKYELRHELSKLVNILEKKFPRTARAWYFPGPDQVMKSKSERRLYPGAALIAMPVC